MTPSPDSNTIPNLYPAPYKESTPWVPKNNLWTSFSSKRNLAMLSFYFLDVKGGSQMNTGISLFEWIFTSS